MYFESDRTRSQIVKYFPIILGAIMLIQAPAYLINIDKYWFQLLQKLVFAGLLFYLYLKLKAKLRFVKVGADKLIVEEDQRLVEYSWNEVESIKRRLAFYRLKMKGKDSIYFTSQRMISLFSEDSTPMGNIIRAKKYELNI